MPDIIINGTSADNGVVEEVIRNISKKTSLQGSILFDLNYGSRAVSTRLPDLFAARYDGTYMLATQAAESFRIWTGLTVNPNDIFNYLVEEKARR